MITNEEYASTTNRYLKFKDAEGKEELVSIDSILESGTPIDSETGDDLELVSDDLFDRDGSYT